MSEAVLHVVRNHAGRMLVAWTEAFVRADPDLARKVIPVPLETSEAYREEIGGRFRRTLAEGIGRGECAWMFYPAKRDDVRTVFFLDGDTLFVKKTVERRACRLLPTLFFQREVAPLPIFKGMSVKDRLSPFVSACDYDGAGNELIRFFDELMKVYPPVRPGVLPECTFDAIPQNCIVDADGKYNFFDLEYDMRGGVPLAYLIVRGVYTALIPLRRDSGTPFDYRKCQEDLFAHYGVRIEKREVDGINAAVKRFNTFGPARVLTNVWLSLLPVRAWRMRFCWWSMEPELKGSV
jgi:hypothetical protein